MLILEHSAYLEKLLSSPRPGIDKILAFYEHRVSAICKDPKLMLIPLDDHLCHRGDGVFESINYRDRHILLLDAHLERMMNSTKSISLNPPCTWDELREIVIEVARAGDEDIGSIRILIGRGPGGFGISPRECPESSLYIIAIKAHIYEDKWYENGLTAFKSNIPAKQEYLAKIKNTNYLPNVLMTEEAALRKMDVAISFDAHGYLAEAAIANIAIVDKNGILACPKFTNSLPGTTLLAALECAKQFMNVEQRNICEDELFSAKEILLFSSSPLCVSITHYENKTINDGKTGEVSSKLLNTLRTKLLQKGTPF